MNTMNERDQRKASDVVNERCVESEDAEWDGSCQLPEREHVNALLDISESTASKQKEPFEYLCLSGWEEAIQGWGRTTPLGCLIQPERRENRMKAGDPDHQQHCLLCVDLVKFSEPHESEFSLTNSPESCCNSTLGDFQDRYQSHTSTESSSTESPTESFLDLQKATQKLTLQGQMMEGNDELCAMNNFLLGSDSSQTHHLQNSQCPILMDRRSNMTLIINNFPILPPVKTCQPRPQRLIRQAQRGQASRGHSAGSEGSTHARERTESTERREEMPETDTVPSIEVLSDDTNQVSLTCEYWPVKQSHHLMSPHIRHVPKRCDPLPCVTYPMGRHLRQDSSVSSCHRLYYRLKAKTLKRSEPQLPILFGTRVSIPASAQRIL
ncbi:hypothetical protein DPEC_G00255750 [Dallia pectoralis]|uniref:Uncharacterized protein n=1 Tax=Dallia pectoralis TaxID=75939 RepID=A0ACC2FUL9_DALPE|nr:hypothetical protein DPEC_G00255750 [Dallia pectoralis]